MHKVRITVMVGVGVLVGLWGQSCLRPHNNLAAWDTRIQVPLDTVILVREAIEEHATPDYLPISRGETLLVVQSKETTNVPLPPPVSVSFSKGWPDELDSSRTRLHSRIIGVRGRGFARIQGAQNQDVTVTGFLRIAFLSGDVIEDTLTVTVPAGQTQDMEVVRVFDFPLSPYEFSFRVVSNLTPQDPAWADSAYGELEVPLAFYFQGDTIVTTLRRFDIPSDISDAADTTLSTQNVEILRGWLKVVTLNATPLGVGLRLWLYDSSGTNGTAILEDTLRPAGIDARGFVQDPVEDTFAVELSPTILQQYIAQDSLYVLAEAYLPALNDTVYVSNTDQLVITGFLEFLLRVDPNTEKP